MSLHRVGLSIGRRTALLALAYVVLTAALLSAMLLQLRSDSLAASKQALAAFAQLAASNTAEVVFVMEDALKVAEVTLSVATENNTADEASIDAMLRGVASSARLQDIFVIDARGRVVYQAAPGRTDIGVDRSDWQYFTQYRDNTALKFDVGRPIRRRSNAAGGEWFVPVTHAWYRANGEFAGVIVGVMDPRFFEKVWTFDAGVAGLSIALTSADGTIIMRRPFLAEAMGLPLPPTRASPDCRPIRRRNARHSKCTRRRGSTRRLSESRLLSQPVCFRRTTCRRRAGRLVASREDRQRDLARRFRRARRSRSLACARNDGARRASEPLPGPVRIRSPIRSSSPMRKPHFCSPSTTPPRDSTVGRSRRHYLSS